MTSQEAKDAFLAGCAVKHGGVGYYGITAIIYRRINGAVRCECELMDYHNNSVTIALAKDVETVYSKKIRRLAMILYDHFLPIEVRSKKNSQRVVKYGGRVGVRQSKQYEAFEKAAVPALRAAEGERLISCPVNVQYTFYMTTRRRVDGLNLSAAVDDCLVKAGVLEDDDRNIVVGHDGTRVYWDKTCPGVRIVISTVDDYDQW